MSHTPTPERVQRTLENIDHNIRMFEGYRDTEWNRGVLERLRNDRAEILELIAGTRTYDQLGWTNKERFYDMPAWGTYGT